jgi:pyrroloquinoline quinone biosynthesis protein B
MLRLIVLLFCSLACLADPLPRVTLHILGVAQDAGYPQMNCYRPHCLPGWQDPAQRRFATSLGVVDHQHRHKLLFEATPDIREQMYALHQLAPDTDHRLAGVFLTHGHMGHYTGLMHFGREAAGSQGVPVYVMPRFKEYLSNNGPWSQLVTLGNIRLKALNAGESQPATPNIRVEPLLVPHRDEFTETVGFVISGPNKKVLFIPDIDKWQLWERDIREEIKTVDHALLDATFYANGEIPGRDMSEIPHPFVTESMALFADLPAAEKQKIIFIHFNHTNPLINANSEAAHRVKAAGFQVAVRGMKLDL